MFEYAYNGIETWEDFSFKFENKICCTTCNLSLMVDKYWKITSFIERHFLTRIVLIGSTFEDCASFSYLLKSRLGFWSTHKNPEKNKIVWHILQNWLVWLWFQSIVPLKVDIKSEWRHWASILKIFKIIESGLSNLTCV